MNNGVSEPITSLLEPINRTGNPSLDTVLRVAKKVGVRLRAEAA
jgi:DNA-binding phage protein